MNQLNHACGRGEADDKKRDRGAKFWTKMSLCQRCAKA